MASWRVEEVVFDDQRGEEPAVLAATRVLLARHARSRRVLVAIWSVSLVLWLAYNALVIAGNFIPREQVMYEGVGEAVLKLGALGGAYSALVLAWLYARAIPSPTPWCFRETERAELLRTRRWMRAAGWLATGLPMIAAQVVVVTVWRAL